MEKLEMFTNYEKFNKSTKYIIGFAYKGQVYMQEVENLDIDMITLESASKNQGQSLRFRPKARHKAEMVINAICIGTIEMLLDSKYNKGDMFEKYVFEQNGQEWHKNNTPFHQSGDINLNGIEIQIKFEKAAFCTSKTLDKLLAVS